MKTSAQQPTAELPHPYPEFRRDPSNRVLAGVCSGLAQHLGVSVLVVRLIAVALCLFPPLALGVYFGTWALSGTASPDGSPEPSSQDAANPTPPRAALIAPGATTPGSATAQGASKDPSASEDQATQPQPESRPGSQRLLLILAAVLLAASTISFGVGAGTALPILVAIIGAALVWRTYRTEDSDRSTEPGQRARGDRGQVSPSWVQWASLIGGTVLTVGGIVVLMWQLTSGGAAVGAQLVGWAALAVFALVIGFGVLLVPLWLRLWRMASDEMQQRAAEAERQRISARIHDSVLQTLALIQKNSSEPQIVALARSQERQLRQWLFGDGESVETTTVMGALRVACGEVEDAYGVQIRPVIVGEDIPSTPEAIDLVLAAREAMINAAKHSGCSEISVYAELGAASIEIFVRDRGPGFDLEQVPADRQGVRGSIIGRMAAAGGSVEFDTASGTEVILTLPLAPNERTTSTNSPGDHEQEDPEP